MKDKRSETNKENKRTDGAADGLTDELTNNAPDDLADAQKQSSGKGNLAARNHTLYYGGLLLVVAAFWGIGNPVLKTATLVIPPLYCLALRFFISFLIFMILFYKKIAPKLNRSMIKPAVITSIPMTGAYVTSAYAMKFTTATNAGFFMSTAVIFTPILGYIFLKSKLRLKMLGDIAIVVAGIFLLSTASGSITVNPGDMIAIFCAFTGAMMFITVKIYVYDIDPVVLTAAQIGAAGIWCLLFGMIFETFPGWEAIPPGTWGSLLFMSIFCTCLAFIAQNVSLKHVSETYVAVIFCMEPVFGAFASFIMLGERLNTQGFIGAAVIMAGVLIASLTTQEEANPREGLPEKGHRCKGEKSK